MDNKKPAGKSDQAQAKHKNQVAGCPSSTVSSGNGDAVTPCLNDGDKRKVAKNTGGNPNA